MGIVALQQQIYAEDRWFVGDGAPSVGSLERRLRTLEPVQSLYLVALDRSDNIAAWLELNRLGPQRLRHVALLTLAVASCQRRQGLASALLHEAYRWARSVDVAKISLNVRANNGAAIRLYEQHGFILEGRERAHIKLGEGFEDNLIMARLLEPGV